MYYVVWLQCVERLDLAGMDFIWRIAMETPDEEIANEAIQLIITYSYTNLNPKMKKVSVCSPNTAVQKTSVTSDTLND